MKKLLLISLLTFGFCTLQLSAMEEREQISSSTSNDATITSEEEKEQDSLIYTIICKNGKLEIDKSQFENLKKISGTFAHLMQDINDTTTLECNVIPLHELESNVVQKILTIINKMPAQEQTMDHTKFIEQLSQRPLDNLISLLRTANYLDIQSLLDLSSRTIACKIIQETAPIQPSFLQRMFSKNITRAEKIIVWLQNNNNALNQLPSELKNMVALQICSMLKPIAPLATIDTKAKVSCIAWNNNSELTSAHYEDLNQYITSQYNIISWFQHDNSWVSTHIDSSHGQRIDCLGWNSLGTILISTAGFIHEFNTSDNKSIAFASIYPTFFEEYDDMDCSFAWHPTDPYTFVSCGLEGKIYRYIKNQTTNKWEKKHIATIPTNNNSNNSTIHDITIYDSSLRSNELAWNPQESIIAIADDYNTIHLLNTISNEWIETVIPPFKSHVQSLAWNHDGSILAAGLVNGCIFLLTSENHWRPIPLIDHTNTVGHTDTVTGLAWNKDNMLASCSTDKTICTWIKISTNQWHAWKIDGHTDSINCLAWNKDGSILASGSDDKTIRLWNKLFCKNCTLGQALLALASLQSEADKKSFEEKLIAILYQDEPEEITAITRR